MMDEVRQISTDYLNGFLTEREYMNKLFSALYSGGDRMEDWIDNKEQLLLLACSLIGKGDNE